MKQVYYTTTLFYCDGPQVFVVRDDIGGHYVAAAIARADGRDGYLVTGVKPSSLEAFCAGEVELKKLLLEVGEGEWYLTPTEFDFDAPIALERQSSPLGESEYLPDDGFVLYEN